jgi:hypothetical protein
MDGDRYSPVRNLKFNSGQFLSFFTIFAALVFAAGLFSYASPPPSTELPGDVSPTSIERVLAIEQARRAGQKTYSYTTSFFPGLGQISDAEAYKKAAGLTSPVE